MTLLFVLDLVFCQGTNVGNVLFSNDIGIIPSTNKHRTCVLCAHGSSFPNGSKTFTRRIDGILMFYKSQFASEFHTRHSISLTNTSLDNKSHDH